MFRGLKFAIAGLLFGLVPAVATQASPTPAQDVVAHAYDVLIGVMKDAKTLGFQGRVERLTPVVTTSFNLPLMAQVAAGVYWGKATDAQRQHYVEAFGRMTAATMAVRFDGYNGEKFDVLGTEDKSPSLAIVKTRVTENDGKTHAINYLMKNADGAWKVADVYADGGISELAVKTADYASVLKSGGVAALTTALENKADALADQERQVEARNTR